MNNIKPPAYKTLDLPGMRHRFHTERTVGVHDSATDPLASPDHPFQGTFVIGGGVSASNTIIAPTVSAGNVFGGNLNIDNWNSTSATVSSLSASWSQGGGTAFTHMFGITPSTSTFKVRPGVWDRNGHPNASGWGSTHVFDPIGDGEISPGYTGKLFVYVLLVDSSGGDNTIINADLSNDSAFYNQGNSGTNGLVCLYSTEELETPDSFFNQFLRIGEIIYTSGVITKTVQTWVGAFVDRNTLWEYDGRQFAAKCIYTITTATGSSGYPRVSNAEYELLCSGGNYRCRNLGQTAPEVSELHNAYKLKWYVCSTDATGTDPTQAVSDPSLITSYVAVVNSDDWPDSYEYMFYYRKLWEVENTTKNPGYATIHIPKFNAIYFMGHEIIHDWVRPDGQYAAAVWDLDPKAYTLGFVPAAILGGNDNHAGELEDYNFTHDVIGGAEGVYVAGDQVLSFWTVPAGSDTYEKKYLRLDAVNSGYNNSDHRTGKSLEMVEGGNDNILPRYMQVHGFKAGAGTELHSWEDLANTGSYPRKIMTRMEDPGNMNLPEIQYDYLADDFEVPWALSATMAISALSAVMSLSATMAVSALSAIWSADGLHTIYADNAVSAVNAGNAVSAVWVLDALHTVYADNAVSAVNAGHALYADNAVSAVNAGHALYADNSVSAVNAGHALYADNAVSAVNAGTAYWADSASYSSTAGSAASSDILIGNHPHENHTFTYDDHDGTSDGRGTSYTSYGQYPARYIIADGDETRNSMAGQIGASNNTKSIDPNGRLLYSNKTYLSLTVPILNWIDGTLNNPDNSPNIITLDWVNSQCKNNSGIATIDWSYQRLNDNAGVSSVDWDNRLLIDINELESVDWDNRALVSDAADTTINWNNYQLLSANEVSLDWGARQLYTNGIYAPLSLDWQKRQLNNGVNATVDWYNQILVNSYNKKTVDWDNMVLYGSTPYTTPSAALDWYSKLLIDNQGRTIIDWQNQYLLQGGSNIWTCDAHFNPNSNITYDLGSQSARWRDLWLSNTSIHMGETTISVDPSGTLTVTNTAMIGTSSVDFNPIKWNGTYTTVNENSAIWMLTAADINLGDVPTLSGNWNSAYTTVNENSSIWMLTAADINLGEIPTLSGNWNSNYTTTNELSALWSSVYTSINALSSIWQSAYTTVNTNSGNWDSAYTTVNTNSATWSTPGATFSFEAIDHSTGQTIAIYVTGGKIITYG